MSTESLFDWPEPEGDVMLSERIRLWRDRAKLAAQVADRSHGELAKITTAMGYSIGEISIDQVVEHVRNAKALADKLQTLLDSKTHQLEALHAELENALGEPMRWQGRAKDAERALGMIAGVLIQHADGDFLFGDPTTLQVAKHIVDKLVTAPEPDMDTVPLADLLEAVGTYLEHDQAVTIRGSFEPTRQVEIHALGLTFCVDTHEASEALTKAQELGGCLVQEVAR
jgi:hypothetical protein